MKKQEECKQNCLVVINKDKYIEDSKIKIEEYKYCLVCKSKIE